MANKCKFEKEREWVSYDGGIVWNPTDNYRIGKLIEPSIGTDCDGHELLYEFRVIEGDYICEKGIKYQKLERFISYDSGKSWKSTGEYMVGEAIEANSRDCNDNGSLTPSDSIYRWVDVEDGDCVGYKRHTVSYEEISVDYGNTWVRTRNSVDKGMQYSTNCMDGWSVLAFDALGTLRFSKSWMGGLRLTEDEFNQANQHTVLINTYNIDSYAVLTNRFKNTRIIKLSDNITSIGNNAFYYCNSLTSLTIGKSVESIGSSAFYGCESLESLVIPDSVESIGNSAFGSCESLESLTIGNSVVIIGNNAFDRCLSLTSLTIPNSVKSIGNYAFSSCLSLTSLTIGNSVTSIGKYAFFNCYPLTSVTIYATNPPTLDDGAFDNYKGIIYVPDESVNAYNSDRSWIYYFKGLIKPMSEKP